MLNQIIWKSSCPLDVSTRRELLTRTSFNRACINASVAKAGLCRGCKANRKDILKFSLICRRVKFQEPSNGFALLGHVFANITLIIGPHMNNHCKNRCIMEQRCRSINIGQARNDKVLCQLSDSDQWKHPKYLKPMDYFLYLSIEVRSLTPRSQGKNKCQF